MAPAQNFKPQQADDPRPEASTNAASAAATEDTSLPPASAPDSSRVAKPVQTRSCVFCIQKNKKCKIIAVDAQNRPRGCARCWRRGIECTWLGSKAFRRVVAKPNTKCNTCVMVDSKCVPLLVLDAAGERIRCERCCIMWKDEQCRLPQKALDIFEQEHSGK